jgi:hypothetical protein
LTSTLQGEDLFLDAAGHDQLVDEHRLVLPEAVGAVGGLVLDRRVPPRVVVDHGIGGGQVEAEAAGLEADQEDRHPALLEAADRGFAVGRVAGEQRIGDA